MVGTIDWFIEVTTWGCNGKKRMLNTKYIKSITPNEFKGTDINSEDDDIFMYEESYEEVRKMLMGE